VTAWRFREARLQLFTSVGDCARLLRVSERTIRGWESGATRIPYASYKLLRVLKGGRYLAHPHWRGYVIRGPELFTPEGHRLKAGELGWLSLLVRRAHAFGELMAAQRVSQVAGTRDICPSAAGGEAVRAVGLSLYSTSDMWGADKGRFSGSAVVAANGEIGSGVDRRGVA
jgi:hypothetical protein